MMIGPSAARRRDPDHLWLYVAILLLETSIVGTSQVEISSKFLTQVDSVLQNLVRVHRAFWAEGRWYNMTIQQNGPNFGLLYDKPAIRITTDPTVEL